MPSNKSLEQTRAKIKCQAHTPACAPLSSTVMRLADLKHLEKRSELLHTLEELSDPEYQRLNWVENRSGNPWDSFDEVVHFFFDDTDLGDDAGSEIGFTLLDEAEVNVVSAVTCCAGFTAKAARNKTHGHPVHYVARVARNC